MTPKVNEQRREMMDVSRLFLQLSELLLANDQ